MHEDGSAGYAVAAGSADFLIIGFHAAGQGGVDDGADVGFVDAHAERDGCNHDFDLAGDELLLHAVAMAGIEAGVVGGRGEVMVQCGG